LLIVCEIDDVCRFGTDKKLHAYAGLIPSTHSSGARLSEGDFAYGHQLKKGPSRVTTLKNVRFERVDGVWVPMEADVSQHRKYRGGTVNEDYHYKRMDFVLNPDHEALGSFDNPIENPKNDPELKDGTEVCRLGDSDKYIWQDGRLISDKDKPSSRKKPTPKQQPKPVRPPRR